MDHDMRDIHIYMQGTSYTSYLANLFRRFSDRDTNIKIIRDTINDDMVNASIDSGAEVHIVIIDPYNTLIFKDLELVNNKSSLRLASDRYMCDDILESWIKYASYVLNFKDNSDVNIINGNSFAFDFKYKENFLSNHFDAAPDASMILPPFVGYYDFDDAECDVRLFNASTAMYLYDDWFISAFDRNPSVVSLCDHIFGGVLTLGEARSDLNGRSLTTQNKTAYIFPFFWIKPNRLLVDAFNKCKVQFPEDDVYVIELSYTGDFYIDESERFIRLTGDRKSNMLWQKERLLNIALANISDEYTNIVWLDGDVIFSIDNIGDAITKALETHHVVQLFTEADMLESDGSIYKSSPSYGYMEPHGHCGYAWAIRRDTLDSIGGFFDSHPFGSNDSVMAEVFSKHISRYRLDELSRLPGLSYKYYKYKQRVDAVIDGDIGFIDNKISHLYHGDYKKRKYLSRNDVLFKYGFDPVEEIRIDDDGLYEWVDVERSSGLLNAFNTYVGGYESDYDRNKKSDDECRGVKTHTIKNSDLNTPSVIILGPSKAATTSLHNGLCKHPSIYGGLVKEPRYYSHNYDKGIEWYAKYYEGCGDNQITIDASVAYLGHHRSYYRILNDVDDPRLIIILRNPVDRLMSNFIHFKGLWNANNDPKYKSVLDTLNAGQLVHITRNPKTEWCGSPLSLDEIIESTTIRKPDIFYFFRGEYIHHLHELYNVFNRRHIHYIIFDDLISNPKSEISKVLNFIGVDDMELSLPNINRESNRLRFIDLDDEITLKHIDFIRNYYVPYNNLLYRFLGRELDWNYKSKWYDKYGLNYEN
jgi:hypothetical protein